jgi:2-alkyl-3-oxoalkanoate reductase
MVQTQVLRLIAISTFSVFDYLNTPIGQTIDENSPIEANPQELDEYAQTKLIQESLVRDFEKAHQAPVTILRPGMVYGRDYLWNACLGAELTDTLWLKIGSQAEMPVTYVENCAEAIVLAAEQPQAIGQTINIVDDDRPTQRVFAKKLFKRMKDLPRMIPVSWTFMQFLTWLLWVYNQKILKGQAKFPGIFVPAKLHARFKPLHYTNTRAKTLLNWTPKYSLDQAFERSTGTLDLLTVTQPEAPELSTPV